MTELTYDEVLKASLNSKLLLYRQVISSFMIKFLCNVEVYIDRDMIHRERISNALSTPWQLQAVLSRTGPVAADTASRAVNKAAGLKPPTPGASFRLFTTMDGISSLVNRSSCS